MKQYNDDEDSKILAARLRALSHRVNDIVYDYRSNVFGKIATIIEASTQDKEQRKSLKDLLSDAIFGPSYMNNIYDEFKELADSYNIDLWANLSDDPTAVCEVVEPYNKYTDIK